jgi:hypothetical protein
MVRAWDRWIVVRFHGRGRSCSVHEIVRAGFRIHTTSYSVGTRDTFAGVKRSEREANHAGPLIPRLRMNGPINPFLRMPSRLAQGPHIPFRGLFKLTIIWAVLEDGCHLRYYTVDSSRNIATFRWILLPASWRVITQHGYTSSTVLVEATRLSETSVCSYRTAQCHYRTATFILNNENPHFSSKLLVFWKQ